MKIRGYPNENILTKEKQAPQFRDVNRKLSAIYRP